MGEGDGCFVFVVMGGGGVVEVGRVMGKVVGYSGVRGKSETDQINGSGLVIPGSPSFG